MKRTLIAIAACAAPVCSDPAFADPPVPDRLTSMERRLQYLEKRVASQDTVIIDRNRRIERLTKQEEEKSGLWFNKIRLFGAVELEGSYSDPFTGDSTTDATVATASIGAAAKIHDWVNAEVSLLYEEDETPIEVDIAEITIGPPDRNWMVKGGQFYVPFGTFETNLVSDPLTLEIGEMRETALLAGVDVNGFSGSVYGFNGLNKNGGDDQIDGFGATVGYSRESGTSAVAVQIGYINDIGDSDKLQDVITANLGNNNVDGHVGGWTASGKIRFGAVTLIGEFVSTLERFESREVAFNGAGARPSAWTIETAYGFRIAGKEATVAVSYQGTDEALALELPQRRFLGGISVEVFDYTSLSLEWAHDCDYHVSDGGSGTDADTVTAQLAVEF